MEPDPTHPIKARKTAVFVMAEDGMDKGLWTSYFLDHLCGHNLGHPVPTDMASESRDKISLTCSSGAKLS